MSKRQVYQGPQIGSVTGRGILAGMSDGGTYHIPAGTFNLTRQGEPGLEYAEVPLLHGDGIHDDAPALQAAVDGKPVRCAFCLEFINFAHPQAPLGAGCPTKHRDG